VSAVLPWVLLVGVATTYGEPAHQAQPLYCDGWDTHWHYDARTPPWVAVDVSEYQEGRVRCGDELVVYVAGERLEARALDAGYLYGWQTEIGGPIVVDVPQLHAPFAGLGRARVVNHSAAARWMEQHAGR